MACRKRYQRQEREKQDETTQRGNRRVGRGVRGRPQSPHTDATSHNVLVVKSRVECPE